MPPDGEDSHSNGSGPFRSYPLTFSGATRMIGRSTLIGGVLALVVLAGGVLAVTASRFDETIQRYLDRLESGVETGGTFVAETDLADLPAPVARYFETVLEDGQPLVETVRFEQRGEFRLGGRDGDWQPFTATQVCSRDPPGFVWDARIRVAPMVHARVLDSSVRGSGVLRARLLSAFPVASAGPSPDMNAGELLRYLAECVWYPTALLPDDDLEWTAIDDTTARATLSVDELSVSLVFHFDDAGLVEQVTGWRYRQEDGDDAPWVGYFSDYEDRNGRLIPTRGEVAWDLPEGESSYWRGTIEAIEHRDGT